MRVLAHLAAKSLEEDGNDLRELDIQDCRDLFIGGMLLARPEDFSVGSKALANVVKLDLSNNRYVFVKYYYYSKNLAFGWCMQKDK